MAGSSVVGCQPVDIGLDRNAGAFSLPRKADPPWRLGEDRRGPLRGLCARGSKVGRNAGLHQCGAAWRVCRENVIYLSGQQLGVDDTCIRIDEGMVRNGMEINLSDAGNPRELLFQYVMAERACISSQQQRDAIVRRVRNKGQARDPTGECETKEEAFLHDDLGKTSGLGRSTQESRPTY